jgi:hypothetical protein
VNGRAAKAVVDGRAAEAARYVRLTGAQLKLRATYD